MDEDHKLLYLFRIPDHERFEGKKYIKRIRIDKDDMLHWDTRGINIDLLKRYDNRILDLTDFQIGRGWHQMKPRPSLPSWSKNWR